MQMSVMKSHPWCNKVLEEILGPELFCTVKGRCGAQEDCKQTIYWKQESPVKVVTIPTLHGDGCFLNREKRV